MFVHHRRTEIWSHKNFYTHGFERTPIQERDCMASVQNTSTERAIKLIRDSVEIKQFFEEQKVSEWAKKGNNKFVSS